MPIIHDIPIDVFGHEFWGSNKAQEAVELTEPMTSESEVRCPANSATMSPYSLCID